MSSRNEQQTNLEPWLKALKESDSRGGIDTWVVTPATLREDGALSTDEEGPKEPKERESISRRDFLAAVVVLSAGGIVAAVAATLPKTSEPGDLPKPKSAGPKVDSVQPKAEIIEIASLGDSQEMAKGILGREIIEIVAEIPVSEDLLVLPSNFQESEIDFREISSAWKTVLKYPMTGFLNPEEEQAFSQSVELLRQVTPEDDLVVIARELLMQMVTTNYSEEQAILPIRLGAMAIQLEPRLEPVFGANIVYLTKQWQKVKALATNSLQNQNQPKELPAESAVLDLEKLAQEAAEKNRLKQQTSEPKLRLGFALGVSPIGIWNFFDDLKQRFTTADMLYQTGGAGLYEVVEVTSVKDKIPGVKNLPTDVQYLKFRVIRGNSIGKAPEVFLWAVSASNFKVGDRIEIKAIFKDMANRAAGVTFKFLGIE